MRAAWFLPQRLGPRGACSSPWVLRGDPGAPARAGWQLRGSGKGLTSQNAEAKVLQAESHLADGWRGRLAL